MNLIGISGKMGTGKSTLVNLIKTALSHKNVECIKFADPLYELQTMIYNKLRFELTGEKDRTLLIQLGMWARSVDKDVFLRLALGKYHEQPSKHIIVIDDVRFPNEADCIIDAGGMLIRLEGTQRGPNITPEHMSKPSETALDNYNFKNIINNEGTQMDVFNQLLEVLQIDRR